MFTVHELTRVSGADLVRGSGASRVTGISIDSRTIKKGEAFLALKGDNFDGHDFIRTAIAKGATCIIKQKGKGRTESGGFACLEVKNSIKALGDIARFHRIYRSNAFV